MSHQLPRYGEAVGLKKDWQSREKSGKRTERSEGALRSVPLTVNQTERGFIEDRRENIGQK